MRNLTSLVICSVITVYLPVFQRNSEEMCVWQICMRASVCECERVFHGHVPLLSVNHLVLAAVCLWKCWSCFHGSPLTPVIGWMYRSDFIFL